MHVDHYTRLESLISRMEPRLSRAFLEIVSELERDWPLPEIVRLLESGQIEQAISAVSDGVSAHAAQSAGVYVTSGAATSSLISDKLRRAVSFDQVNTRAVAAMQANQIELARQLSQQQRAAVNQALVSGVTDGINPVDQARRFRDAIGLTDYQEQIVRNYRRELENLDTGVFSRQLRDRRYDRTVRRAIDEGESLRRRQIDTMVSRYRQRWIKHRSEAIARTEALRSVHEGNREAYRQAIANGVLDGDTLRRQWISTSDRRTRDHHASMNRQVRGMDEPFVSGDGISLMIPGDRSAPARETVHCRCAVTTRFRGV